ncbi:hypothetical protein MKZ38_006664 [Zalerion maritima]|uniref:Uncharacterized protein n=1 Tax=Zalerion maritima TaxID=339359 RepID=A0AAD5RVC0_9PEZI|nr:hypothetical protein MKZ38_006664 [Zalerion maritima]
MDQCSEPPDDGICTLVHPLLHKLAWDAEMARKNSMALDTEEYMAKIAEAKQNALGKIKDKLLDQKTVPGTEQESSIISQTPLHNPTSSQKTEEFPLLDTGPFQAAYSADVAGSLEEATASNPRSSASMTPGCLEKRWRSNTGSEADTGSQSSKQSTRSATPQSDPSQQSGSSSRSLWGLSRLLPKLSQQGKSKHQRDRTFTAESMAYTSSSDSSSAKNVPPPHKLQKMPSYTGLDDLPVPSRSASRRAPKTRDDGHASDSSIRISSFAVQRPLTPGGSGTDPRASVSHSAAPSLSVRKPSFGNNTGTPSGSRLHSRAQTPTSSCFDHPRDSRTSEASTGKISVDFDSRNISFNDPAIHFPKNKASRAQAATAEQVYEDCMERMRSHAIERARAIKEDRPSGAPYTRQGYVCADNPGEDFKIVYECPPNEEVARYAANPKPSECGPVQHEPNQYLDPLIKQAQWEKDNGIDPYAMHNVHQAQNILRPLASVSYVDRTYENPRPAPQPPQDRSDRHLRPANTLRRVFSANERPLPPLRGGPPTKPLPTIPPIEPGTSRRLSREIPYYQENIPPHNIVQHSRNRASTENTTFRQEGVPRALKEFSPRFGNSASDLRADSAQGALYPQPGFSLRVKPSQETIISSHSSQENFSDHLSTIDERSETRSVVTVIRAGQSVNPSENNLGPLIERLSYESTFDLRDIEAQLHGAPSRQGRRHSAPSVCPEGERRSIPQSEDGDATPALEVATTSGAENPFNRPLLPLTGRDGLTTPLKRVKSFSHLEGTSPIPVRSRVGGSPLLTPHHGGHKLPNAQKGVENDTPLRLGQRLQMRQNQRSLLELEHAAFGGPPHRDLQNGKQRFNVLYGPPGPPPNHPLPPDPPVKSCFRGQRETPSTPQNKGQKSTGENARNMSPNSYTLGQDIGRIDFRTQGPNNGGRNGEMAVPSPPSCKYNTRSKDGSTLSLKSQETNDSFGRKEPREAGYSVSPLRINKTYHGAHNDETPNDDQDQNARFQTFEMQDIIDAINMDAEEIKKTQEERLGDEMIKSPAQSRLTSDYLVRRTSSSLRSDATRTSASLRDLFKSGFQHNHSLDTSRSDDSHRPSAAHSASKMSGKSSLKSSVKSTVGAGGPHQEVSSSPGPGSIFSSTDEDRPSTSHFKGSANFLHKLKSKASFDVLRRRRSFVKGKHPSESNSSSSSGHMIDFKAFWNSGRSYRKGSADLELGTGDLTPAIPPLPNIGRLTMTIAEEDLERYGIRRDRNPERNGAETADHAVEPEDDREDERQKTLEKLRGRYPNNLDSVVEGETITNLIKKDGHSNKKRSGESRFPTQDTPAPHLLNLGMPHTPSSMNSSVEKMRHECKKLGAHNGSANEMESEVKEPLRNPVPAILTQGPTSSPSRASLVTVQEALLGSKSPNHSMPSRPLGFGPPEIPPRQASRQRAANASTISQMTGGSGHRQHRMVPQLREPDPRLGIAAKPNTPRLMKQPSYGQMPASFRSGRRGHTPIDITVHATAHPTEALSSPATVMSLAPKTGGENRVQEKSRAIASALPKVSHPTPLSLDMVVRGGAPGRITPIKQLRNVASAGVLGSETGEMNSPALTKKGSLERMSRMQEEE